MLTKRNMNFIVHRSLSEYSSIVSKGPAVRATCDQSHMFCYNN